MQLKKSSSSIITDNLEIKIKLKGFVFDCFCFIYILHLTKHTIYLNVNE